MKDNMFRKVLAIGIIVLFTIVGITPSIGLSNYIDDTTPPVTTISFYPETPDGENDWYVTTVTVWLDATDDMSGVNNTYYSINSGDWEIYDTPIILEDDSLYYITYFSIDIAGNMEFPKLAHIKVDQTPPFINLTHTVTGSMPDEGWTFHYKVISVDFMSGMNRVIFFINDVPQKTIVGSGPFYRWDSVYYHAYWEVMTISYDHAGNEIRSKIITPESIERFPMLTNFPRIKQILERFPLFNLLLQRLRI